MNSLLSITGDMSLTTAASEFIELPDRGRQRVCGQQRECKLFTEFIELPDRGRQRGGGQQGNAGLFTKYMLRVVGGLQYTMLLCIKMGLVHVVG